MRYVKLRNLIELFNEKNTNGNDYPFYGLNIQKEFMPTVAETNNLDNKKYKIVKNDVFVFSGMQTGRDNCIRIGLYKGDEPILVSPAYTTFYVSNDECISDYLFMYFKSSEKDRFGAFLSDGSVRSNLDWDVFCDIEIPLPSKEIQRKYVAIYKAMQHNLKVYESKLEGLKLVCDGYIEELRRKYPCEQIGKYLNRIDVKNTDNKIKNVKNVSVYKYFNEPTAKVNRNDLKNYKIVKPRQISFVQTTHNEKVFAYAINRFNEDVVVSSVNEVFETDISSLLPEYLCMFFSRKEFDRYARFHSWGSARETFTWDDLIRVSLPIPRIEIQENIAKVFDIFNKRKQYVETLKKEISNICPILIAGAIKEAKEYA